MFEIENFEIKLDEMESIMTKFSLKLERLFFYEGGIVVFDEMLENK